MKLTDILLRDVVTANKAETYQDNEIQCEKLRVGSARTAQIQLCGEKIAKNHLVIEFVQGKVQFQCKKPHRVLHNGVASNKGTLAVGDDIHIESHRLTVIPTPAGFGFALEVRVDTELQNHALESAYNTTLAAAGWGTRRTAYITSLLVILFAIVWPLASHFQSASLDAGSETATKSETSQSHPKITLTGNQFWSSGPLLPAHKVAVGNDCVACHEQAFQQVTNAACESCHQLNDHAQMFENFSLPQGHSVENDCQGCHKEHNEPATLIVNADGLCTDCHSVDLHNTTAIDVQNIDAPNIAVQNIAAVSGFSLDSHSTFKLSYLQAREIIVDTKKTFTWDEVKYDAASNTEESSHLKFNHQVHFNPEKMRFTDKPDGMDCNDCHRLLADNEHFAPITMENDCASCHELKFDTDNLERELPHGQPKEVLHMLQEHFVRMYTDPNYKPPSNSNRRRRVGVDESSDACTKGFECGMQKAEQEARAQFTQGTCNYCHQVEENDSSNIFQRWQVLPVHINNDWYTQARFDHASHLTQKQGESTACLSCHQADVSEHSTDVLIPGIDNCVDCHGDASINEKITLNCISCHAYHPTSAAPHGHPAPATEITP